jgi:ribosomal protein S18 acetylase RimI-like enzyme
MVGHRLLQPLSELQRAGGLSRHPSSKHELPRLVSSSRFLAHPAELAGVASLSPAPAGHATVPPGACETEPMEQLEIAAEPAASIPELEPLWEALHAHHAGLGGGHPVRPLERSWARRRAQYERWLAGGAELLLARRAGVPAGYAVVMLHDGPATWDFGERVAELETLSVAPAERGCGVGAALVKAARETARAAGAQRLLVGVAAANAEAIRFYEREGFGPFYVQMEVATAPEAEPPQPPAALG